MRLFPASSETATTASPIIANLRHCNHPAPAPGLVANQLIFVRPALSRRWRAEGPISLTSTDTGGASRIMGDKSPKANQKQKAQQKAKTAAQKKERPVAVNKTAPRKK